MGEGAALLAFVDPQAIASHRLLLRVVPCGSHGENLEKMQVFLKKIPKRLQATGGVAGLTILDGLRFYIVSKQHNFKYFQMFGTDRGETRSEL